VQVNWQSILPIASVVVALGSMIFSFRSSQIARNSLRLTQRSAQAAYEAAKANPHPAVSLSIHEIEYRQCDAPPPEKKQNREMTVDDLFTSRFGLKSVNGIAEQSRFEVVVRGKLVNNIEHDVLLTFRPGGRKWINFDGDHTLKFARSNGHLLMAGQSDSFEYVVRRSTASWLSVNRHLTRKRFAQRYIDPRDASAVLRVLIAFMREVEYWFKYRYVTERCELMFVCEPRFTERVATVWRVQIRKVPVSQIQANGDGAALFHAHVGLLEGPFDDSIVFYRGEFDSTLAQLEKPRFPRDLPGGEM
jgi:hypothetical protein